MILARLNARTKFESAAMEGRFVISPPMDERISTEWRPRSESNRRTRLCRPLRGPLCPTWPSVGVKADRRKLSLATSKKQKPRSARGFIEAAARREAHLSPSEYGAGNETRTRDPDLGKVVLYQLSYSRASRTSYDLRGACQLLDAFRSPQRLTRRAGHAVRR